MFSPRRPTSCARSSSSDASAPGPSASTASSTFFANARNSSLFETGSVSHPTATIEPRRLSSASRYPTFPSGVSRSARFAAPAIPFSRSRRTAASMSPFVSCSARLQSIIGAPVWSRSSLTRAAEISAICRHLTLLGRRLGHGSLPHGSLGSGSLGSGSLGCRRLGGGSFRDGLLARRHLLVVALGHRRRVGRGAVRRCRPLEVRRRRLLLAGGDAVRDHTDDQVARPDRVVVARSDVVGLVRIAVRVDECDDRQAEPPRLADRELLLPEIDDENSVRLLLHIGHAAEVLVELLELAHHGDPLLRGEQIQLSVLPEAAQLVKPVDPAGDRAPVREQPAEPAMRDVRHSHALRLLLDRRLALLL